MYRKYIKRMIDIIVGIIALPITILAILIFAPIIFLEDRGTIFYTANRRGLNGEIFKMYKLRTMKMDAPDIRNKDRSTYNSPNDSRITKIGRILRKTSIDELPQVFNVIKGDMSVVGPRPTLATRSYEEIDEERKKRYEVRPGITGYAQAYFRNSISQEERYRWDIYYVDNVSFLLDVKIVFKTFFSVLKQENIYIESH